MIIQINKSKINKNIEIPPPPSKSISHRMIICAALANKTSILENFSLSEDMKATLDCINALGIKYSISNENTLIIEGHNAIYDKSEKPIFNCRESGSTLRFFIPIALTLAQKGVFIGTERLIERGIGIYEKIFLKNGIKISKNKDSFELEGTLKPGIYELEGNVSSQFITGLMFALPLLNGNSIIKIVPPVESYSYIKMTIDVLKTFGILINQKSQEEYFIQGNQQYLFQNLKIEGDWSNAAALLAFGIKVSGLKSDSTQGDKICIKHISSLCEKTCQELRLENNFIDISDCPDLGPILFAIAASKNGGHFTGTARLRIKESDRVIAMKTELAKFGVNVIVKENEVIIEKQTLQTPTEILDSHNDHRIVMAMSYLASITGGTIKDADAINKSFPDYFKKISDIGVDFVEVCK